MPRRDRTGPWGAGPLTGRGMGLCRNSLWRMGAGLGLGLGLRYMFRNSPSSANQLQAQKEYLQDYLRQIEDELASHR